MTDFAHSRVAHANRVAKAYALAQVLWDLEHPSQLADQEVRRAFERAAGVRRASDETWRMAIDWHREMRAGVRRLVDESPR